VPTSLPHSCEHDSPGSLSCQQSIQPSISTYEPAQNGGGDGGGFGGGGGKGDGGGGGGEGGMGLAVPQYAESQ